MGHPSERTAKRASPLVREQRRDVRASEYPGAGAFRVAQAFPEVEGRILPVPVQENAVDHGRLHVLVRGLIDPLRHRVAPDAGSHVQPVRVDDGKVGLLAWFEGAELILLPQSPRTAEGGHFQRLKR